MVTIDKSRITIVINDFCAAETYTDIVGELIDLLQCKDKDFTQQHNRVLLLLENMMPTTDQVIAMYGVPPEAEDK